MRYEYGTSKVYSKETPELENNYKINKDYITRRLH